MKDDLANTLTVVVGLLTVAIVLLSVLYHIKPTTSPKDIVYDYCNHSRILDEPKTSEQTCGDLQDFYNVEFLCSERNSQYNNTCWVEEK